MKVHAAPFHVVPPQVAPIPLIVSVPHCGSYIPADIRADYTTEAIDSLDDTDWFVDHLYEFVPSIGGTLITSHYSRYVIDLNRPPDSTPLYSDGRRTTRLVPSTTFEGQPLYRDEPPTPDEIERRKKKYYWPYHDALVGAVQTLQTIFPQVLLWEAHSIRRVVKSISEEPFPDMILGDAEGESADARLSKVALQALRKHSMRDVNHNAPFKGGYITRAFGQPETGVHALQLEMSKDLYMDAAERELAPAKADKVSFFLEQTLLALVKEVQAL